MSILPGNPYATAHNASPYEGENEGDWAIAQATLALAYEQRNTTLALIATSTAPDGTYALDPELVHNAQSQLANLLGLGDTK